MDGLFFILLACTIVIVWNLAGRYEWQIPTYLSEKITYLSEKKTSWKYLRETAEAVETVVLNIEAREFITDDMEKEIYIVRRSRKPNKDRLLMNVEIQPDEDLIGSNEIVKAKLRLEKRFPGLTINVTQQDTGGT